MKTYVKPKFWLSQIVYDTRIGLYAYVAYKNIRNGKYWYQLAYLNILHGGEATESDLRALGNIEVGKR